MKKCCICYREFPNKGIGTHIWRTHTIKGRAHRFSAWNKGLTKESNDIMGLISKSLKLAHKEGRAKNHLPNWLGRKHKPETLIKLRGRPLLKAEVTSGKVFRLTQKSFLKVLLPMNLRIKITNII